jgi:hypothetical protein
VANRKFRTETRKARVAKTLAMLGAKKTSTD